MNQDTKILFPQLIPGIQDIVREVILAFVGVIGGNFCHSYCELSNKGIKNYVEELEKLSTVDQPPK